MTWTTFDRVLDKASSPQGTVYTLLSAATWVMTSIAIFPIRPGDFIVLTCWSGVCIVAAMVMQTWIADARAEHVARLLLRGTN